MNKAILIVGIVTMSMTACQGDSGVRAFQRGADVESESVKIIADDLVDNLARRVPPGSAKLAFTNDQSGFAKQLEISLARAGYDVSPQSENGSHQADKISYFLMAEKGQIQAGISSPPISITRTYRQSSGGTVPIGSTSVTQRDEGEGR